MPALEDLLALRNVRPAWAAAVATLSAPQVRDRLRRTELHDVTFGGLSWKVADAHAVVLGTPLLVQVEDVINVSAADPRAHSHPSTLQLVLTDGAQEFVAIEWRTLAKSRITIHTVPGTKLILAARSRIARGLLLLEPDNVTLIGAPPAGDVWGERGRMRRIEALKEAGLPLPNTTSFDAIAAQGPVRPMGLADEAIAEQDDEVRDGPAPQGTIQATQGLSAPSETVVVDDDQFWAVAVAAEEARVSAALNDQSGTTTQHAVEPQLAPTTQHAAFRQSALTTQRSTFRQPPPTAPPTTNRASSSTLRVPQPRRRSGDGGNRRPSDVIVVTPPKQASNTIVVSPPRHVPSNPAATTDEDIIMDSDDDVVMEVSPPSAAPEPESTVCPLHYVDDERGIRSSASTSVYRVVAQRTKMSGNEHEFVLALLGDDGASRLASSLRFAPAATLRATRGRSSRDIIELTKESRGQTGDTPLKRFKRQLRYDVRAMHGFVRVRHRSDEEDLVDDASSTPPQGLLPFMRQFVANLERRWDELEGVGDTR